MTRAIDLAMHKQRRAFTGFMFGRGSLAGRLYDKTPGDQDSDKPWFRQVWARSPGYDPQAPGLAAGVPGEARGPARHEGEGGRGRADGHRHLAGRPRRTPAPSGASCRAGGSPCASPGPGRPGSYSPRSGRRCSPGLRRGPWGGTDADLYREAREAGSERTTAQLAGYLARGFAEHRFHHDIGADLDEALPGIIWRARAHAERTGRSVETRARERVVKWVSEAESIALGSKADVLPIEPSGEADDEGTDARYEGTP